MIEPKSIVDNVVGIDLDGPSAIRLIRSIAEDSSRVFFSVHAEQQMTKRRITRPQVFRCLKHGVIVEGPARSVKGNWELALEVFSAGEPIRVVAALDHDGANMIVIITAYRT